MAQPVVCKRGEGKALWVLNGLYEFKLTDSESDGAMTVGELTMPPGGGPPPHTHPGAELVYVLEGRLEYRIGDETVEGGPGDFFYVPEGVWESYSPTETTRVLVVWLHPGMTEFFEDVGEPAQARELPALSEPDVERVMAAGRKRGLEMRPPAEV